MNKQGKKKTRLVIFILLIMVILASGVYFYLSKEKGQEAPAPVSENIIKKKQPLTVREEPRPIEERVPGAEDTDKPAVVEDKQDHCLEIENMVKDFFLVLNKQAYIKQINPDMDTYEEFKKVIKKLSKNPPSPAGEGLDPRIMSKNIFYFFRVLDDTELRLIREIIKHEEETLELNLSVFYKWLTLGDKCPDPDKLRPSFSVLYSFSGFFTNTIGGRAYLFRRPPHLRQLVNYYALLIIHKADIRRKNSYGIDILPGLRSLTKEMAANPDLLFQQEYLDQLNKMMVYYENKR